MPTAPYPNPSTIGVSLPPTSHILRDGGPVLLKPHVKPTAPNTKNVATRPIVYIVTQNADADAFRSLKDAKLETRAFRTGSLFLEHLDVEMQGCILIDCPVPDMSGIQIQARANAREVRMPVIFITSSNDVSVAVSAMHQGAFDYLLKPVDCKQLQDRVASAIVQNNLFETARRQVLERVESLTSRECDVMHLLLQGESNKRIATQFQITVQTATKHRSRVLTKMRVENEVQLVRLMDGFT